MKKALFIGMLLLSLIAIVIGISVSIKPKEKDKEGGKVVYFTSDISSKGMMKILEKVKPKVEGKIAIKVHFGEKGNRNFINPELIKELVTNLNAVLIETNVLYVSDRRYTESHKALAREHGFNFASIDIIDDEGETVLQYNGKHFKEVRTGSHLKNYDTVIVISHFKGHVAQGFGGAIKNVGMGMASIPGKMSMHASAIPQYSNSRCIQCGLCVPNCPVQAITIDPVKIDEKKCIGCASCIGICPEQVFGVPWGSTDGNTFQERVTEYAAGISQHTNMVYINVLNNISAHCDCIGSAPPAFTDDIGILASFDMVAVDKACLDLVNEQTKLSDAFATHSHTSGNHQLDYAEEIGLGSKLYQLIDID
ncbi:MAG: DUF362 domain-containing protein [Candidatus Cloacimonetes bacterium]|nr:DUF362 domain-containing protein [Candidatus Cloacimonadota bacterium]